MGACDAQEQALQAAQEELAVREVAANISATPANIAAVSALQQRVADAARALNACNALNAAPPVVVPPTAPVIGIVGGTQPPAGGGGGGITTPPPVIPPGGGGGGSGGGGGGGGSSGGTGGTGGIGGTGIGLDPVAVAAALDGYLNDDNFAIENFIADTGAPNTASDSWNFLVTQVESVWTDAENALTDIETAGFGVDVAVSSAEVAAGTTADIVGIDAIGLAVGFLIAQQMAGWIITNVGEGLPDPNVFGWHPMGFIKGVITDLGNKLQTLSQDTIDALAGLIMQPVRQLTGLFQRGVNTAATQQNQHARIVQDTVPTAKQDAITAAEAYTDNAIAGVNNAAGQALVDLPASTTLDEARALVSESTQYDTLTWKMIGVGAAAMVQADEYADTLKNQTAQDIANSQAAAEQAAQTAVANLQTQLVTRLTGDENSLSSLATTVNTTIPNEIETATNNAVATENQKLTAATATIEQQITAIQAQITTLQNQVSAANTTIATAQSTISDLQSQATVDESAIAQQQATITAAQTEIATSTTAISDLYTQITSISSTLAPIQATQQIQTSQISSITTDLDVALPTLLATMAATINTVKTQVDTCTVDTCDPQSPNYYKNILMDLLGALTAAAEIGFIAEAVKDPTGTANALAPLLDSIGGSGIDALDALLSL